MDDKFVVTTIVTIVLAFIALLAKYLNDVKIANRKDKLDRVNRQLKELYGPLLALVSSSSATWDKFREKNRNMVSYFNDKNPPSESEKEIWRNWMENVFVPINEKIYSIVIGSGDLIIEDDFPTCLKDFCAHVEGYRPVIRNWQKNDFSLHTSLLNYPTEIVKYVEDGYKLLKVEQKKLIK